MKKLQCELCGSIDIVKTADNLFECQSCGCKYTAEQAKSLISGTVEVVKGQAECERLLKNALVRIKLGDFAEAEELLKKITSDFPDVSDGWSMLVLAQQNQLMQAEVFYQRRAREILQNYSRAVRTATDSELLEKLQQTWDAFWKNYAEQLKRGEKFLSSDVDTNVKAAEFPAFTEPFAALSKDMADVIQYGINAANTLEQNGVSALWGYTDIWFGPVNDHHRLHFVLGRQSFVENRESGWIHTPSYNWALMPQSATPLDQNMLYKLQAAAEQSRRMLIQMGRCPSCGSYLEKKLFGYKCARCRRSW